MHVINVLGVPSQFTGTRHVLWLIFTNGDGFGFGSLGRRSIPKMGTVTIRETIRTGKLFVQGSKSKSKPVEKVVHNTM